MFRRTRLASFQLNRKDVASISSRVLRESFEKLGRGQKEKFGEGVERKEGGACFKEIKVNFTNVHKRRFTNIPNREISRGVLRNGGFFLASISPSPLFLFFSVTGEFSSLAMGECALSLRSIVDAKFSRCRRLGRS